MQSLFNSIINKVKHSLEEKKTRLAFWAVILHVYGYNYLHSQCAYDVASGGLLARMV